MSEKEHKHFKWLSKLKNIKHIEIYIAILFIVLILLMYLPTFSNKKGNGTSSKSELTVVAYIENLEQNLEEIISNIRGVTNVNVMITLDMKHAEVVDSKITINNFPDIKGVVITAEGVDDTATKLKVLHAVETVLEIKNGCIEILSSK